MEGFEVKTHGGRCSGTADIFVTRRPVTSGHHYRGAHGQLMKDKAIIGNIGHFDNEIDMAGLKKVAEGS